MAYLGRGARSAPAADCTTTSDHCLLKLLERGCRGHYVGLNYSNNHCQGRQVKLPVSRIAQTETACYTRNHEVYVMRCGLGPADMSKHGCGTRT